MAKITLDRETFKALASDTRLDILKALDGKNLGLNEIAKVSNLNKATLHEHLTKLNEAGLIKRTERDGHKWVYYKLTWKGESLLHPENTKIVVLFATTFVALWVGVIQLIWYIKGTVTNLALYSGNDQVMLSGKSLTENNFILGATNGVADGFSQPSGLPDLFQTFLMRARLAFEQRAASPVGGFDPSMYPVGENSRLVFDQSEGVFQSMYQNPLFLYVAVGCFVLFTVFLCLSLWRLWENRAQKI
jgi:DNA-binding transcriptional ArsR family regulator